MDEEAKSANNGFGKAGQRDLDSYSESDEGVQGGNAAFQSIDEDDRAWEMANKVGSKKRGSKEAPEMIRKGKGKKDRGLDSYSESDEGVSDDNAFF